MPPVPNLPPIASESITVVLLMKDAAAHLQSTLGDWVTYLNGLNRPYEILVIDDKCQDGSADLARAIAENAAHVRVLSGSGHGGDGVALRLAFAEAKYPLLFTCRLEPCYQPAILRKLLQEIDKVHVVSGYRSGRPKPIVWRLLGSVWRGFTWLFFSYTAPPLPGWLGWHRHFGAWLAWFFFGVLNHDVTSPVRLLRREILTRIPLQSDGVFVHVEILAKANFLGKLLASDVPLGDRHYPIDAKRHGGDSLLRILADAHVVFHRPDFGPAHLPVAPSEPVTPVTLPA